MADNDDRKDLDDDQPEVEGMILINSKENTRHFIS